MIIYCVTNQINGKQYIGQTTKTLAQRQSNHMYNARSNNNNMIFHNALMKYEKDVFIWEVLKTCKNMSDLNCAEIKYISLLNTLSPNGYNLMTGGNSSMHSDETRKKMSESHKKRYEDPVERQKISDMHSGRKCSEKLKKKMSKIRIEYFKNLDNRKKLSEARMGMKFSEEHKRKLSKVHKDKKLSEEHKRKLSKVNKGNTNCLGKKHSQETKRKMSQSQRERRLREKCLLTGR